MLSRNGKRVLGLSFRTKGGIPNCCRYGGSSPEKQAVRNDTLGNTATETVFIEVEGIKEHEALRINDMKQYLVVKIAKQLGALAMEVIPVAGLFPLDAAEQFVRNAVASEPESLFLIQQVGNA